MNALMTVAKLEFVGVIRLKWVRMLTAAFALLAGAAAYAAGAASEFAGADNFARTTMALVPVTLILIPLAAMILGVSGQSAEAGSEPFLFAQPLGRLSVLLGRWLGELAALAGAIVVGLGIGAIVVASSAGPNGIEQFGAFVGASIVLAAIFLSLAAAIAASTEKRVMALGVATFTWFFFVLLYDGIALSLAGWITGWAGGRVLFASVFGNPADLVRIAMLFVSGTASVLGAAGEAWVRFLGGEVHALTAAAVALAVWMAAPLAVAGMMLGRRDL
jgi:Cu-processing system permease protein